VITPTMAPPDLTVVELLTRFWEHAERHYPPTPGSRTSELDNYRHALRPLRRLYGETRAADFGPMELMLVRDEMIAAGWCRNYVNRQIGRLKHVFKWAAKFRLVPPSVREGLAAVEALRPHRSPARETAPVAPVAEDRVTAVLDHLAPPLRAMVELQALTGARSGELCIMRTIDVDTSGAVWIYRPSTHKTAHRGHAREIRIGPRSQAVLRPYLKPDLQAFVFSPADAEACRRELRRERRRSRPTPSQIRRAAEAASRRRPTRERYTTTSYRRAVARACEFAFGMPAEYRWKPSDSAESRKETALLRQAWHREHVWHPHQLRHTAATRWRREYGPDVALVLLGDRSTRMIDIYAQADSHKANVAAGQIG
jgi:integrase